MHTFTLTLTEDEYTKLKALLAKNGVDVNSTTGTLPEQDGVVLSYAVHETADPDAIPVEFTIEHKRFFESTAAIENHVKHLIETATDGPALAAETEQSAQGDSGADQVVQDDVAAVDEASERAAENETTGV